MKRYIPYEKLQKRQKKELAAKKRGSWGAISPVTRKSKNEKVYNRKNTRMRSDDGKSGVFLCAEMSAVLNHYKIHTIYSKRLYLPAGML